MFSDDVVALFEDGLEEDEREEFRWDLSDIGAEEVTKMVEETLGRTIAALAILNGVSRGAEIARLVTEAGHKVSQQSISNYKTGRKMPPVGFIVAFVKALDLNARQKRELLRAYMHAKPELEDFVRLWDSERG